MKKLFTFLLLSSAFMYSYNASAQEQEDKTKRPSPPATVTQTINSGATITIDYSQPALKGRTMGKDVEPMNGKVWRAGANEATIFNVDKDVKVQGKELPAGKYALYMLANDDDWTIIFNKKWEQWGTKYEENKGDDFLKVNVKAGKTNSPFERLTYTIDKSGKVSLMWGDRQVDFIVE